IGIAGVLVLFPKRLDEADRLERSVVGSSNELHLIAQMRGTSRSAVGKVGVVIERVVVILEQKVWTPGKASRRIGVGISAGHTACVGPPWPGCVTNRIGPSASVPRPVNPCCGETIAYRRICKWRQPLGNGRARRIRPVERLNGVYRVIAAHNTGRG